MSEQLEELLLDAFHPKGTYVNAKPIEEDRDNLYKWVSENGVNNPLDKDEYHVTIVYSQTPCPDAKHYDFDLPIEGKISGWDVFDSQISPTGKCLVARLDSEPLQKINTDMKEEYGATSTYPDYKPHITVSYNHQGDPPKTHPDMKVTFNKVEVKALNPDWRPDA